MAAFLLGASGASAAITIHVTRKDDPDTGVGNCATTDHSCSVREAINAASDGDTISLPAGTYQLTQPSVPQINKSITLTGAGARTTTIRQTVNGQGVLYAANGQTVTIRGVTITGGHAAGDGGGITNLATLTLKNVAVTGNEADGYNSGFPPGSPGFAGQGGGIFSLGSLTIMDSTLSGNSAQTSEGDGAYGGAIYAASVKIVNSTITDNSAVAGPYYANGGGIFAAGSGVQVELVNVTLASNHATGGVAAAVGGNLYLGYGAGLTATHTIIAQGTAGSGSENCLIAGSVTSKAYNLEDRSQCGLHGAFDRVNTNAKLGPLKNHGGFTDTLAPLFGSPAINGGTPGGCKDPLLATLIATDQRGVKRPQAARCDIGAFEFRVLRIAGKPRISGTPQPGEKLTCLPPPVHSPDGPVTKTFVWLRDGGKVGAGPTYLVKASDVGRSLSCRLVAVNAAGAASARSAPVSVTAKPSVAITFVDIQGHTATFKFTTHYSNQTQCALPRGGNSPHYTVCESPKAYRKLPRERYTFYVRAIGYGQTSAPARQVFKIG